LPRARPGRRDQQRGGRIIIIAAVSFLVAALFLDETKGADINRNDRF
jgi:hypothetical protein